MAIGAAVVVFVVCCVLPLGYLLGISLRDADSYSAAVLDARQRRLLANTTVLGAGTAFLATAIGASLGGALARVSVPGKGLLRLALTVPLLLPPYIMALAWTYLGAGGGLVSDWTYSLPAAVVVLSLAFYPLSMLATEVAMRRIDGRLEEAALLVASPRRVLWRITVPLAAPAVIAAALLVFVLAISDLGVPGLLRVRVYTTEVFAAFAALYDLPRAILLAVPLLVLCLIVAAVAALMGERVLTTRRSGGVLPLRFDSWRHPTTFAALGVVAAALVAPLAILIREARSAESLSVLAGAGPATMNSLRLAAAGATIVVIVATCLGYGRARASGRIGPVADVLFLLAFAVPGTVAGVGLIGLWNRSGAPSLVYGTEAMLLIGYVARFLPVAALALAVTARSVPISHEEAAAVCGAGWPRTMWRIILPQMRLGLAASWTIVLILAFGELGVSILVAPPGESTLPIRVYTLIANAPSSDVAALALVQVGVIFIPLAVLGAVVSRRGDR